MTSELDQRPPDLWSRLRIHTQARIGLQRSGSSLATAEMLSFQLAHARARDAVHVGLDADQLMTAMVARSWATVCLHSAAPDRRTYLLRPDLGRKLNPSARAKIETSATGYDLAIVVADGLSAVAVQRHAIPLLDLAIPRLQQLSWRIGPVAIVAQGRVAIGDEIGALLSAQMVVVLIGERPGLSAPDSLGAYVTWAPAVGRSDAERNCISNIRPEGLGIADAAAKLIHLVSEARRRGLTGVMLKDESETVKLVKNDRAP
ncbi:MAG: ethanolamine ammonia-lyase subunit EutC [Rhodospirillaceae bacterium]|nr:MAG: ethanolamine ammonia-lyase subunit EutC [Rhodospirillaceae bacterium]